MGKMFQKGSGQFSAWATSAELPFRLAILMALSIFVAEVLEAAVVHGILRLEMNPLAEVFFESSIIVVLLSPMLYYFLYLPLKRSESKLRDLSNQILMTQETERRRISRELHDELGQALSLLKLRLGSVLRRVPEDQRETREGCNSILTHIDTVIEDVRRLSRDLSPTILEDLGLTIALRRLIKNLRTNYDVETTSDITNIDHLFPHDSAVLIYRIFQEAFTNIGKHAEANTVTVVVSENGRRLFLSVTDDGKGFDIARTRLKRDAERGLGLAIMEERARMLGGSLEIRSQERKGTQISLTIPLEKGLRKE